MTSGGIVCNDAGTQRAVWNNNRFVFGRKQYGGENTNLLYYANRCLGFYKITNFKWPEDKHHYPACKIAKAAIKGCTNGKASTRNQCGKRCCINPDHASH